MKIRIFPQCREDPGEQEFRAQPVITCALTGRKLYRFLEIEVDDPDYFFCGGMFYWNKDFKEYCLNDSAAFKDISLHDSYAAERVFPHDFQGKTYISSFGVNLPLFYVQGADETFGFSFRPFLEKTARLIPFFFYYRVDNARLQLSVNLISPFESYRKSDSSFKAWRPGGWRKPTKNLYEPALDDAFRFFVFHEKAEKALRSFCEKAPRRAEVDTDYHLKKCRDYLLSLWEDKYRVFSTVSPRFSRTVFGIASNPTFDTLLSDTYLFSKAADDSVLAGASERYKEFLLSDLLNVSVGERARVWHNGVYFNNGLRSDSVYNTGIGGFPGGQATLLRALFIRYLHGDRDDRLLEYAACGANWLVSAMFRDGHWARSYVVPGLNYRERGSDTGEASLSVGANAEGSLSLLLAYQALGDKLYLENAVAALGYVNRFLEPGPIAFGYLRDNKMIEPDGISAVFCILANLKARALVRSDEAYLKCALKWAAYLLSWVRLWEVKGLDVDWSMDPLANSFKPRVSSYETSLASSALLEIYDNTGDNFWMEVARNMFSVVGLENAYRGYSEGLYISLDKKLKPVPFESAYAASAVMDSLLKYRRISGRYGLNFKKEMIKGRVWMADNKYKKILGSLMKIASKIEAGFKR